MIKFIKIIWHLLCIGAGFDWISIIQKILNKQLHNNNIFYQRLPSVNFLMRCMMHLTCGWDNLCLTLKISCRTCLKIFFNYGEFKAIITPQLWLSLCSLYSSICFCMEILYISARVYLCQESKGFRI